MYLLKTINQIKNMLKVGAFFGSTQYEMDNFFCGIGESKILENVIKINDYPFKPSQVYPSKEINASEIAEIYLNNYPPTIKIGDELIFISREYVDELEKFADGNNIKKADCNSNWNTICDPFVDTEFDDEYKKRSIQNLKEKGFTEKGIADLREEIGEQMYKYNFDTMLWDWCGLGLKDVLSAMRVKLSEQDFEEFYWRAMEIEQRN